LVGKIQEQYGIAKEDAQRQVDEWLRADERKSEQSRKAS
jgi:uncharacterized protein YjbJ (UPF0337 family)